MPKLPVNVALSLFTGGYNEVLSPARLAPHEAQAAVDVDYRSGALRGLPGPGADSYGTAVASPRFLYYFDGNWITAAFDQYALYDGQRLYLTRDGDTPVIYNPAGNLPLGLTETPAGLASSFVFDAAAYLSKWFKYGLTYVTADGVESNPTFLEVYAGDGETRTHKVTITYTPPTDPRITKINVYRSNAVQDSDGYWRGVAKDSVGGATYGTLYLVGEETTLDGTFNDTGAPNGTVPLLHDVGGVTGSSGNVSDHSGPPVLTMLSNGIHSTTQANGSAGILVGLDASGNVRYSGFGTPHYWPTVNSFKPPGDVQAIVTHTAMTAIITDRAIYAMTGLTDDTVSFALTNSNVGCLPGAGRAAIYTPYGVVFPSVRGIELFDGDRSTVLTADKLEPATLAAWTIRGAAFWDNRYFLFHSAGTLIMDLRAVPDVVLTTSSFVAAAVHVGNAVGAPPDVPPPDPTPTSIELDIPYFSASSSGTANAFTGTLTAYSSPGVVAASYGGTATISFNNYGWPVALYIETQPAPEQVTFVNGVASFGYRIVSSVSVDVTVTATLDDDPTITDSVTARVM